VLGQDNVPRPAAAGWCGIDRTQLAALDQAAHAVLAHPQPAGHLADRHAAAGLGGAIVSGHAALPPLRPV
jgi:hypothetical protein